MFIFVANPSLQHYIFNYRVPGVPTIRNLRIQMRGQAIFPEDFAPDAAKAIVAQLERRGAVPHNDPRAIQRPNSLTYKVEDSRSPARAIKSDAIEDAAEVDKKARQDRSNVAAENAGLGTFAALAGPNEGALRSTSLEVEQIDPQSDEHEKDGVNFEVKVDRRTESKIEEKKPPRQRRRG